MRSRRCTCPWSIISSRIRVAANSGVVSIFQKDVKYNISGKHPTNEHKQKLMEYEASRGIITSCAGEDPYCTGEDKAYIKRQREAGFFATCQANSRSAGSLDEALYFADGHENFVRSANLTMSTILYKRPWIAPGDQYLHSQSNLRNEYTIVYEPKCGESVFSSTFNLLNCFKEKTCHRRSSCRVAISGLECPSSSNS